MKNLKNADVKLNVSPRFQGAQWEPVMGCEQLGSSTEAAWEGGRTCVSSLLRGHRRSASNKSVLMLRLGARHVLRLLSQVVRDSHTCARPDVTFSPFRKGKCLVCGTLAVEYGAATTYEYC